MPPGPLYRVWNTTTLLCARLQYTETVQEKEEGEEEGVISNGVGRPKAPLNLPAIMTLWVIPFLLPSCTRLLKGKSKNTVLKW